MKQSSKSTVGILGFGEVGQAIAKFYKNPQIKTRTRDDGFAGVSVLHVCIPWTKNFITIVEKEISSVKPALTIIHSTVAPGTTKKLIVALKDDMIVHSPIRGIHPHLYSGVKTFVKYIGADSKKAGNKAKKHLENAGMKAKVLIPSQTTELGKLLSTTYYGLCIAWHGEMEKMCKQVGVDFSKAVTDFNETYNQGYITLKKKNVVRPVLYSPIGGSIGGHCIVPNATILREQFQGRALDLVLEYKPKKGKK